jgi:hypothetical protein
VENIAWGDTALTINLKNSNYKRETNLSTVNENGTVTPVCFGNLKPALTEIIDGLEVTKTTVDCPAKFVRTVDSEDNSIYTNAYFDTGATLPLVKIFPVTNVINNTQVVFQISGTSFAGTITPEDVYMIESGGQIRQVTSIVGTGINSLLSAYVKDVFLTELVSSGDTRTWVQFVKIARNYKADSWPCKDFLKSADGTATVIPELSTYDSDANKYNRIADFGFTVKDTDNNALDIDGSQFSSNIDSVDSFLAFPVTSLSLEDAADLTSWNCNSIDFAAFKFDDAYTAQYPLKLVDGLYKPTSAGNVDNANLTITNNTLQNASRAYDKTSTTYAEFSPNIADASMSNLRLIYLKVLKFGLPTLPKGLEVDSIHLGIKLNSQSDLSQKPTDLGSPIFAIFRRFAYNKTTDMIIDDKNLKTAEKTVAGVTLDDIMDQYYSDTVAANNLNFYREGVVAGAEYSSLTGYTFFQITDKVDEYNTFVEGGLFFNRSFPGTGYDDFSETDTTKIYELCIIVKLASSDIKKEIYSPLSARVYGDTWESRKTAADLIENPVDIIEHIKRLQNWSEFSPIAYNWGHEYAVTEDPTYYDKIRTSSFDSANLNYLTDQKVAMEITDEGKATSSALVKKLCDTFGVCTYIDPEGYECIETLELTNPTGAANTITLADIIGGIGDYIEPRIENIFCEPVVNYQYDNGAGKFRQTMKVTHIDAAAWQASYTPGIKIADGERVWNSCKTLYNKYRQIEQCPSEFSDQYPIPDYSTALAYLERKIAWMDKSRLPLITVAYSKGKDYTLFKHLMIQLPMHTNNVLVECIIEKIVKSKNTGTVKINCVILGAFETAWYDTADSTNEYQDTPTPSDPAVIDQ